MLDRPGGHPRRLRQLLHPQEAIAGRVLALARTRTQRPDFLRALALASARGRVSGGPAHAAPPPRSRPPPPPPPPPPRGGGRPQAPRGGAGWPKPARRPPAPAPAT